MVETRRYCPDCGRDRLIEQPHAVVGACPDAPDAPDGGCAEWCCTRCGAAMLIGFPSYRADAAYARQPASRVA
jgi:hypothetical protein